MLKHLISLKERTKEDLLAILTIAGYLKADWGDLKTLREIGSNPFVGKKMLMLFEKNSTRTKISFDLAVADLKGCATIIDSRSTQGNLASKKDELKVMASYADVLMYRALDVRDVEFVASLDIIPVIDGCSNKYHPSQALADILTMSEIAGGIKKIGKVAWIGIENNVSNTLAMACHTLGIALYIASPLVHENSIDDELTKIINASSFIKRISLEEALENASFVHTDTWVDMEYFEKDGNVKKEFKSEFEKRKELLTPYQISAQLLEAHNCNAKIMHCMPCHVGMEITRDAIDHENSVIFHQAENRLHIEKAMLWWMFQELKKPNLSGC